MSNRMTATTKMVSPTTQRFGTRKLPASEVARIASLCDAMSRDAAGPRDAAGSASRVRRATMVALRV